MAWRRKWTTSWCGLATMAASLNGVGIADHCITNGIIFPALQQEKIFLVAFFALDSGRAAAQDGEVQLLDAPLDAQQDAQALLRVADHPAPAHAPALGLELRLDQGEYFGAREVRQHGQYGGDGNEREVHDHEVGVEGDVLPFQEAGVLLAAGAAAGRRPGASPLGRRSRPPRVSRRLPAGGDSR